MKNAIRWTAMTVLLAAGAALVKGEMDVQTEPSSGEIHTDKDQMSIKGDRWKQNSTTASPSVSTDTTVSPSTSTGTIISPSVSTSTAVSPSPR
jgi:hypothetical protein